MGNMDRLTPNAATSHSQLLGAQCGTGLLGNRGLERLGGGSEKELPFGIAE